MTTLFIVTLQIRRRNEPNAKWSGVGTAAIKRTSLEAGTYIQADKEAFARLHGFVGGTDDYERRYRVRQVEVKDEYFVT